MFEVRAREVTVTISSGKCDGCGKCVEKCGHGVMRLRTREDKPLAWHAFPENCMGCERCAKACRNDAILIIDVTGVAMGEPAFK